MTNELSTDYLVVGAGAAGLAFVDTLIAEADADVVIVDRRHRPGGHWNDAYPFVRLHQASANYGVNSRALGTDSIDTTGRNAGFYELATGVEICDYFRRVLDGQLLSSGRVRFYGGCDYVGDWSRHHAFTSRLSGQTTTVRVRRKLVDTTYLDVSVPATHTPTFSVDPAARCVPVGDLVDLAEPPAGFTILGGGKTAMDACGWLLDNGVDPDAIEWVRPRESWVIDRALFQPLDLVAKSVERMSLGIEALADAETVDDLFRRLEAAGGLGRIDRSLAPTMYRGAILSEPELQNLRQVERVVRRGRVVHLGAGEIVLEDGSITAARGRVNVDCTAAGFRSAAPHPIFEPGRITLQSLTGGFTTYYAALVGFVEARRDRDDEKNRLCRPTSQPDEPVDWIRGLVGVLRSVAMEAGEPDLKAWVERSRLNVVRGMGDHSGDPAMRAALRRWVRNLKPALRNAERLLAANACGRGQSVIHSQDELIGAR